MNTKTSALLSSRREGRKGKRRKVGGLEVEIIDCVVRVTPNFSLAGGCSERRVRSLSDRGLGAGLARCHWDVTAARAVAGDGA